MNYKLTTNELWVDHETMDGNSCEWNPFIMWPCPILVSMTSPSLLMMSSTNSDLGFAWISSMKFFHFLHGIWLCLIGCKVCLLTSYSHQWMRCWSLWFYTLESKITSISYSCLPLTFTNGDDSWTFLGMVMYGKVPTKKNMKYLMIFYGI
jgi:hypothetical protein